jgi:transcription-repair coupling factor (superfamily II helicase)
LPYDRLSPQTAVMSARMATLAQLPLLEGSPHILVTTISAAAQRLPARNTLAGLSMALKPGQ